VGLCVPDLVFTHRDSGARVYLEVLGFWSRDAVWRRVELVERGLPHRILFAVSDRLRVSEAVLGGEAPGALYVYKGVMSARAVEEHLDRLLLRPGPPE
jgi:predicted nuclease of restriction endonuclease-like RecB superfamily